MRLYDFVKEAWPLLERQHKFVDGWALVAICEHLEAVTRGDIQYLLINVPPGMAKSLIVSVFWPAWEWGPMGKAYIRFLTSSYDAKLAIRDNAKMRRLVNSEWFQALWPHVRIAKDQNAKTKFDNTETGGRECKAFEYLTGGRGDRVVIDDPHSVDGGESDTVREGAVQTFRESISDRLNDIKTSAIVVIMQRLHQSDLSGAILEMDVGYVHLCLPMEYEAETHCETYVNGKLFFSDPRSQEGELLFPERFPRAELDRLQKVKGDYAWNGQYQQRPAPREGGMFKPDKIAIIDEMPGQGAMVRGWDLAGSTKKTSPYTVGLKLMLWQGELVIMDVVRDRKKVLEAERMLVKTARNDDFDVLQSIPQDPGSAGKSQKAHLAKKLQGRKFKFSTESGSKEFRAQGIAAQVNSENVSMLRGPWNAALIEEMRNFPNSTFKDQVDALSRAYFELLLEYEDEIGTGAVVSGPDEGSAAFSGDIDEDFEGEYAGDGDGYRVGDWNFNSDDDDAWLDDELAADS